MLPQWIWRRVGSENCRFVWNSTLWQPLGRSRSAKVIDFVTDRKPICDFYLWIIVTYVLSCTISKLSQTDGQNDNKSLHATTRAKNNHVLGWTWHRVTLTPSVARVGRLVTQNEWSELKWFSTATVTRHGILISRDMSKSRHIRMLRHENFNITHEWMPRFVYLSVSKIIKNIVNFQKTFRRDCP